MRERYEGKVRVHPVITDYIGSHIDTSFTTLGPNKKLGKNLVLTCHTKTTPLNIPAIFRGKNWVIIEIDHWNEEVMDPLYNFASPSIGLNFFMIDS